MRCEKGDRNVAVNIKTLRIRNDLKHKEKKDDVTMQKKNYSAQNNIKVN